MPKGHERKRTSTFMELSATLMEATSELVESHEEAEGAIGSAIKDGFDRLPTLMEDTQMVRSDTEFTSPSDGVYTIDFSAVQYDVDDDTPQWFSQLTEEQQEVVQELIEENMDKGRVSQDVKMRICEEYNATEGEVEDLVTYFLMKQGEDHDQDVVFDAVGELGLQSEALSEQPNETTDEASEEVILSPSITSFDERKDEEETIESDHSHAQVQEVITNFSASLHTVSESNIRSVKGMAAMFQAIANGNNQVKNELESAAHHVSRINTQLGGAEFPSESEMPVVTPRNPTQASLSELIPEEHMNIVHFDWNEVKKTTVIPTNLSTHDLRGVKFSELKRYAKRVGLSSKFSTKNIIIRQLVQASQDALVEANAILEKQLSAQGGEELTEPQSPHSIKKMEKLKTSIQEIHDSKSHVVFKKLQERNLLSDELLEQLLKESWLLYEKHMGNRVES